MKHLHSSLFLICLIIMVAIIPSIGFAQPVNPNCDPIIGCPIDGGVSLLIAIGIGIGAKKSYANQKSALSKKK